MEKTKITITYKNNEKLSHVHKLIYKRKKQKKFKKFHITITKSQANLFSKAANLGFVGSSQPINVKILNSKPYKGSKVRLLLGYLRLTDLLDFMYVVGYLECLSDYNEE